TRVDPRHHGAHRARHHARHVRPPTAPGDRRQLLRHSRDGSLLRADGDAQRSDRGIGRGVEALREPLLISVVVTVDGLGSVMGGRFRWSVEGGALALVGALCLRVSGLRALRGGLALPPVERVPHRAKAGPPLLDRLLGGLAWAAAWAPRRILVLALVLL